MSQKKKVEDILSEFGKDITEDKWQEEWKPIRKGKREPSRYHQLFEEFSISDKKYYEINLNKFPEPQHKKGTPPEKRTTKQMTCYSSFHTWKSKEQTQKLLKSLEEEPRIRKKGKERIALYKEPKEEKYLI